jgi:uncharacterized protein YhfF
LKQSGHSRNNCEQYTTEKARRDYGSYASEILEGQQTTQEDAQTHLNETFHVDRHNLNNNETVQKISVITKSSGNNVCVIHLNKVLSATFSREYTTHSNL